jgi:hypothetical protein
MPKLLFAKGYDPRRKVGRTKGVPNRATKAVKDFFIEVTSDPEVQQAVRQAIIDRDRGALQAFLGAAAYVIPKPMAQVQVETTPSMARLMLLALEDANAMRQAERERAKAESATPPPPPAPDRHP